MTDRRIALLDASHQHPATRRNFRRELAVSLDEYDVTAGELPDSTAYDGVVVTGSRASVYWDEPWIEATHEYVDAAIEADVPTLGVCWGHQLIADVLGGSVVDMGEYEIGYREIVHDGRSPLLAGIDRRFLAYTTHSDEVAELPPGASVIAENDTAIQGFQSGVAFGVQFHPEYDRATAREVTEAKDELDPDRKARALESITPENERRAAQAKGLFDNFVAMARPR
ncbi:MAG: type 1 glutamine amidotransferase [Halobacteriota archaeon]